MCDVGLTMKSQESRTPRLRGILSRVLPQPLLRVLQQLMQRPRALLLRQGEQVVILLLPLQLQLRRQWRSQQPMLLRKRKRHLPPLNPQNL